MNKTNFSKRIMALFFVLVTVFGLIPNIAMPVSAAEQSSLIKVHNKVADPSSFDNWKDYYGTNALLPDGTRGISTWKAGGVWTDKSVYSDSSSFPSGVTMDNPENNFLIALSALASNKEIVGQSSTPTDSFLVLDVSGSMDSNDKAEGMVEAANRAIDALMAQNRNNRVGVMLYSGTRNDNGATATTLLLPLDHYTTTSTVTTGSWYNRETIPAYLTISDDNSSPDVGIASGVRNADSLKPTSAEREVVGATYIQRGLFDAWKEFEKVTDVKVPAGNVQAGIQRSPVIILMSDGRPTLATDNYNNVGLRNSAYGNGSDDTTSWQTVFLTQLTAAWVKGAVADHYGTDASLYTLGLGTSNDRYATGVLDPGDVNNSNISTWWKNFQTNANQNGNVLVEDNRGSNSDWSLPYDTDHFAADVGRNYSDGYWSADDVADMIGAFQEIIDEIGLQSAYSATLVEKDEANLDGYITVQDELGAMMQVKDVKGILLGDTLFSGEELAESLNTGALGGIDTPTAYGDEFVHTVKERLGLMDKNGANGETITATAQAQQLIQAAYADEQLSYNAGTGAYSNYIGWYGDSNNAYLGFWDKDTGLTAAGAPAGAKYINRSYGYLGGASTEEDAADMMHIVVMVRTEIATGHQTVLFKIPSSLIPMVKYKVELEGDSLETAANITLTVTESDPIRLVYEVGLPDDVNSINIAQKVADYLAQDSSNHIHKDAYGNYVFYANSWDDNHDEVAPVISDLTDEEKLALTQHVAESHFVPNTVNERFYVLENSVIYTKDGDTYTPVTTSIDANTTYYFPRTIVTIVNGTAQAMTQYEQLQAATVTNTSNFQKNTTTGFWEIKAGTIRQQLSNVALPKTDEAGKVSNPTGTLANTDQLWVDVVGDKPSDYNIYSFLGNNGKLTVEPATGIKITKHVTEVANGASATEEFSVIVTLGSTNLTPVITDTDGIALSDYTAAESAGKTVVTLHLADGESAVISNLPAGVTYTVTEAAHEKYTATYNTGATATVANTIVENLVTNEPVRPGSLYITKEVVHAYGGEVFPTNDEFKFEVTFKNADGTPIANTAFQLENNYDEDLTERATNENGVMTGTLRHGETVHILGIPSGATVTVEEVNIPDKYNKTAPVYRSRDYSGGNADNDGAVTINSEQNATVVVTNTYTPDKVGVDISFSGTKNFNATSMTADSEFTFKLQEYKDGQWTDVDDESVAITKGKNSSEKFEFTPLDLEFEKPGTHSYQIVEVKGENTDITYDRSVYTFSVNVEIDSKGDLQAKVVGHNETENTFGVASNNTGDYTVTTVFTNYYHKTATSIAINKTIEDTANSGKTPAGFVIETYKATVDRDNWTTGDLIRSTVTDAQGEALLVRNYDNDDFIDNDTDGDNKVTYHFIIKEKEKDTKLTGWTYDATEYRVTVVLTKDTNEKITADFSIVKVTADSQTNLSVGGDTATITFKNTYNPNDAEVELDTLVKKELEGRSMEPSEFTFAIFDNEAAKFDANGNLTNIGSARATGTNDDAGNVTFTLNKLTFSKIGKYEFDIVEVKGTKGGVTYDSIIYDLVVEVTDNNGTLEANYYFEDSVSKTVTFKNTYTVQPTQVVIEGLKSLTIHSGYKVLTANMFTFGLYENGEQKAQTKNLANGSFSFDAIKYGLNDAGKTFNYVVKEEIPAEAVEKGGVYVLNGVTYSKESFTVAVEVMDNRDGTLSTSTVVTGNGADKIEFVNVYASALASVELKGRKELDGRNLTDGEYQFTLHTSDAAFTEKNAVVQQNGKDFVTNNADGEFTFNIENLGMGYHYYILSEVIPEQRATGISYDASVYHITVQVSDSGNGQMTAITTVSHSGQPNVINPDIIFRNIYSPDPITHNIQAKKTYEKGLKGGDFEFILVSADNKTNVNQTKANAANGDIKFDSITFSEAGEYKFKLTEKKDGIFSFILPSQAEYEITITVVNENGVLRVSNVNTVNTKNTGETDLEFTNTYVIDGEDEITLRGTKKLTGGRTQVNANEFEFGLYDAEGKLIESVKSDTGGNFAFTTLKFDEKDVPANGQKQITYTVKEIKGSDIRVTYDETVYTVVVTVKDNEQGGVTASYTVNSEAGGLIAFTNIYTPKPEDITVDFDVIKTVVNKGSEKIGPEGFEFLLNALADGVADITVKADENGKAKFTLTFTEDDIGNTYTYKLTEVNGGKANVTYSDAEYTITVAIELNENNELVATLTKNSENVTAVVAEFENVYDYTPTPEYPDSPQTGDNTNLHLWFALLFVSGCGMIGATLYGRKKRKEEN